MNDVNKKANGYNIGCFKKKLVLRIVDSYRYKWNGKDHANNDTDKTKTVNKMKQAMPFYRKGQM